MTRSAVDQPTNRAFHLKTTSALALLISLSARRGAVHAEMVAVLGFMSGITW